MKRVLRSSLLLVAALFLLSPVRSAPLAQEEVDALVEFTRTYRIARADSIRAAVAAWSLDRAETLPVDLRDRLALLESLPPTADAPLEALCLIAATLHSLVAEPAVQEAALREDLAAAAATATQECLVRLTLTPALHGARTDSLRALGDPSRRPPAGGVPILAAPTPPPFAVRPARILLERSEAHRIAFAGPVDWFDWVPGEQELLVRAEGRLFAVSPDGNRRRDLGEAGDASAPPPEQTPSGEYVAAADAAGRLRVLRRGVAAEPWRRVSGDTPVEAFAFSPARLELAWAAGASIVVLDLETGTRRVVAEPEDTVAALHWSPRGTGLAWDGARREGTLPFAGVAVVHPGGSRPPSPAAVALEPAGPPQWAPDGVSLLAPGRREGKSDIWVWNESGAQAIGGPELLDSTEVIVSPDFAHLALHAAGGARPDPWGWESTSPFLWDRRPWTIVSWEWTPREGMPLLLDRPTFQPETACWGPRSRHFYFVDDERAGTLDFGDPPLLRRGLWVRDRLYGDRIPLTREPAGVRRPRTDARGGWIAAIVDSAGSPFLWTRHLETMQPAQRDAERLYLRALPLLRKREHGVALAILRDAVRMYPEGEEARWALGETYLSLAPDAACAWEAGLLAVTAAQEFLRLAAQSPGNAVYRGAVMRAFLPAAVIAGRTYSGEAASRVRAFLGADPEGTAEPERVRSVLLPALLDVWLWDPANPEGKAFVADGLRYYRAR